MAHPSVLRKSAAIERAEALGTTDRLLPEDSPARELLHAATADVVGKYDESFQTTALVGALARIVAAQEERIAELEASAASPRKRSQAKTAATK